MKSTINQWIKRIESASVDELKEIQLQWITEGGNYEQGDWYVFWRSFTDRELILNGHSLNAPDF